MEILCMTESIPMLFGMRGTIRVLGSGPAIFRCRKAQNLHKEIRAFQKNQNLVVFYPYLLRIQLTLCYSTLYVLGVLCKSFMHNPYRDKLPFKHVCFDHAFARDD